jgi:hypothetical protein
MYLFFKIYFLLLHDLKIEEIALFHSFLCIQKLTISKKKRVFIAKPTATLKVQ